MPSKNTTKNANTLPKQTKRNAVNHDDESSEEVALVNQTKTAKNVQVEDVSDDSDENSVSEELVADVPSESETEEETDKKAKKNKDSFDELSKRLDSLGTDIKTIDKEITELTKELKTKEKTRNDYERQRNNILKVLSKTHSDEVNRALKTKPKRKGNVNGGFNREQPVPPILASFLGLGESATMSRPKVMSALNNKFNGLKLKEGQNTTLDKATAKALGLGKTGEGRVIKFTEFQSFLASFYPKKTDEATTDV
jgi:hypothetical protein